MIKRENESQRVANLRKKSREESIENADPTKLYKSNQAYGKAIKKAERALPKSPRKKRLIVSGLMKKYCVQLSTDMDKRLARPPLEEDLDEQVRQFFFRTDIVYTCPGINDTITIWDEGGKKLKLRKFYLLMHLKEAHAFIFTRKP